MPKSSFLLLLLLNLISFSVVAQKASALNKDTSVVHLRNFDEKAINEYKSNSDFDYGEVRHDFSPTWWQRFWNWFWDLFRGTVSNTKTEGIFKYFVLILGCAALIFTVIKLSGMDHNLLFTGKSKQLEIPYTENLENIHEISFDDEINKAVQNNDYRLAVRLLYLKVLKGLSDSGRINWQPDKTNSIYINELNNPSQKEKFRLLTQRFEYVWYGSFPVNADAYKKISNTFSDFNPKIG